MCRIVAGVGRACVAMTQSELMRAKTGLAAAFCCVCTMLAAQTTDDPVAVFTEHPRLFLRPQRLRLLKRERERASPRWQQLETLLVGGAPMPEPGFAWALYFQVSGNQEFGRKAIVWALTAGADVRQQALVFDWCQDLLTEAQRRNLTARLAKGIADTADAGIPAVRSRTLAAIALYDHAPQAPQRALDATVHQWWEGRMVPAHTRHVVVFAAVAAQGFADLAKQAIALEVPVAVVDLLKSVQVADHHGEHTVFAPATRQLVFQAREQGSRVGQIGEVIRGGRIFRLAELERIFNGQRHLGADRQEDAQVVTGECVLLRAVQRENAYRSDPRAARPERTAKR